MKNIKEIVKQTERNRVKSCLVASATAPDSWGLAGTKKALKGVHTASYPGRILSKSALGNHEAFT